MVLLSHLRDIPWLLLQSGQKWASSFQVSGKNNLEDISIPEKYLVDSSQDVCTKEQTCLRHWGKLVVMHILRWHVCWDHILGIFPLSALTFWAYIFVPDNLSFSTSNEVLINFFPCLSSLFVFVLSYNLFPKIYFFQHWLVWRECRGYFSPHIFSPKI